MKSPLLSVGIPAYDRPATLERAVRSVLAQQLRDLEVVVSDDASPDPAVAQTGERLAREDARVRFMRQPTNLGHAANYVWVLQSARGEFFMWLSDDDWLDPGYARRCVEQLRADPSARLVCGLARYYRDGAPVVDERPIDLRSRRPGWRVVRYFGRVNMNGPLFGVARREDLLAAAFRDVVGGDWLLVSAIAAQGQVRTLADVHIHRSMSGLGSEAERLSRSFGLRGFLARHHHLVVAANLWREIAWRDSAYDVLPRLARLTTATLSAAAVLLRFPGVDMLRRAGLGGLEQRAIAWVRARDRRSARC